MSWHPRRRKKPEAADPRLVQYALEVHHRDAFEQALSTVLAYVRPMLQCPQCWAQQVTASGWARHEQMETTRNFFTCTSCYCEFFHDSDVLTSCGLAAISVYDRCMMYSAINVVEDADEILVERRDELRDDVS